MRMMRSCGSRVGVEEEESEWRELGQVLSWVPIVVDERATKRGRGRSGKTSRKMSNEYLGSRDGEKKGRRRRGGGARHRGSTGDER